MALSMTDLRLFNSLTREIETFKPVRDGEARVYTCGPTVYNYPHIGNMRAYDRHSAHAVQQPDPQP